MNIEHSIDCRHYRGDRPCNWNKTDGSECPGCKHVDPVKQRVLIVKLDAMGDVLRSTVILPKLHETRQGARVTWLTRKASATLLTGNPHIDEIWILDEPESIALITAREWDLVINLDNSPISASLATIAKAREYIGFVLSKTGIITPTNHAAAEWLTMACFDRAKKANKQSYQEHMYAICGFNSPIERPVLTLSDAARQRAASLLKTGLEGKAMRVGINTGAGGRWPLKMMDEKALAELIGHILQETDWILLLLGGPGEKDRNDRLARLFLENRVIHAGCEHPPGDFAALTGECSAMLCGDTLALHIATALGIPTVALFCPTSFAEIYDYDGLIFKIQPDDCECLCGYNRDCPWQKDCMNHLSPSVILDALRHQMTRGR